MNEHIKIKHIIYIGLVCFFIYALVEIIFPIKFKSLCYENWETKCECTTSIISQKMNFIGKVKILVLGTYGQEVTYYLDVLDVFRCEQSEDTPQKETYSNNIISNTLANISDKIYETFYLIKYWCVNLFKSKDDLNDTIRKDTKDLKEELHSAVLSGKLEEVKRLIANGADVNIPKDDECYLDGFATPLLLAVYDATGAYANKDSAEIAKILIQSGADVNVVCNTKSGAEVNPLSLAIDDIHMMKLLIKAGADVNAKIKRNTEPDMSILVYALHYAGNSQSIVELLSNGADYNADYAGNKIVDLCLYITERKYSDEKYKNLVQNCSSLLQYLKQKTPKALQNNSTSSVMLPSEYNQRLFKNIETKEFQVLLREGIKQYLTKYLKETGNQTYSGNLDDYLLIFTPYIPLPEKPVVLSNTNIEFTYGTYEIAAGYIGPISFSITKEKLEPFFVRK